MTKQLPTIDVYCFEKQFQLFKRFVERRSYPLSTFGSNDYLRTEEGYKDTVHKEGHDALNLRNWHEESIGTGAIAKAVISAVEFKNNNLVTINQKYGPEGHALYKLFQSLGDPQMLVNFERVFFDLFYGDSDQDSFTNLVKLFGERYPIIAYLFFLKDRSQYMPIAPKKFDSAFEKLGINFTTSKRCSWENYMTYISLLKEIQILLMEKLEGEVRLLDAHSFAYILAEQMSREIDEITIQVNQQLADYWEQTPKEKESVINARIGQGEFRKGVIRYFERCAVTDCANLEILTASHTRPWKDCDRLQARDSFNGGSVRNCV